LKEQGRLFVVSAPSGAGKTTLIKHVLDRFPNVSYSVSSTTRSPRKNEQHGIDYFFITPFEFEQKIDAHAWLEWAKVHDHYYGTSKQFVEDKLFLGHSLLLDIDVQGAAQVMASDLDPVTIFIEPPSIEELSQRLYHRGTDAQPVIEKRLKNAVDEMKHKEKYQYCIVNDDLKTAVEALCRIFEQKLNK
jgi:guanylate kinase